MSLLLLIAVTLVFGPEVPTGRYKHPASIAALANGDLYLVYYGGAGEYAVNTGVFGARLRKGETKWTQPKLIAADPFRSVGNGVIWQAPDGVVWLFYVVRYGSTWSTSRIQGKISRDNGETWSDSFVVSDQTGMMVRNQPIVLDTGDYLLPVYQETGEDTESVGPDSTSRSLRFDPKGKSREWIESGVIRSKKGNIQPGVVQLSKSHLIAYCRRGGGYGPVKDGYIVQSESHDGGKTWSEGVDSPFPNPNSAIEFIKLRSGNLLLIFNDSMSERTPLTAALSVDGGRTWPYRRNIGEQRRQSYAYPFATQSADGNIHVVYTSDNRTTIHHAVFDEEWIKNK
jgi:predicted neuraminidase